MQTRVFSFNGKTIIRKSYFHAKIRNKFENSELFASIKVKRGNFAT